MDPRLALVSVLLCGLAACTSEGEDADESRSGPASAPTASRTASTGTAGSPFEGAWRDGTASAIGTTAEWTNKVEIADLDGDGDPDLLFANRGDYRPPRRPVMSRVFLNSGEGTFTEVTGKVLGATEAHAQVLKAADLDGDGLQDVMLGATFQTQSLLFLGVPGGTWKDATATHLPSGKLSVGDLEPGDVDGDGDLDLVLAVWGRGDPTTNRGGRVRLWLNDGSGRFTDATDEQMPDDLVGFSWDLELVDVDNDWDLDVATSCKACLSSRLYVNDGRGTFEDVTDREMPATRNNYDFAPLDLDGDGFLDLVTVNDGAVTVQGAAEHVFRNSGSGGYVDATDEWWPEESNVGWDDGVVAGLDVESDGDADFLVGSLDGPDRLLLNDGSGHLSLADDVFDGPATRGTLGMAVADLDGDGRPDVVDAQGETPGSRDERVWFGTEVLAPDTAPPVVRAERSGSTVFSRVHDNSTSNQGYQWRSVVVRWDGGQRPLEWYGEHLYRAEVPLRAGAVEVCATDAAGNRTCVPAA